MPSWAYSPAAIEMRLHGSVPAEFHDFDSKMQANKDRADAKVKHRMWELEQMKLAQAESERQVGGS